MLRVGCGQKIFTLENIRSISQKSDLKQPVTFVSFSQQSMFCFVGYSSGSFAIYKTEDWKSLEIETKHRLGTAIMGADWSTEKPVLIVEDVAGQKKIFTYDKFQCKEIEQVGFKQNLHDWHRGFVFSSWQVRSTDQLLGLRKMMHLDPALAVCCHAKTTGREKNELLAVGCGDGRILLFKYPLLFDRAEYHAIQAHKSPVVSICFTKDMRHLISAGRDDGCVCVWDLFDMPSRQGQKLLAG